MAPINVPDATQATIDDMITASREIAEAFSHIRDKFAPVDVELAAMVEGLRRKFDGFADAAAAGQVTDPLTLSTLSRVYQDAAMALSELAEADGATVRSALSTATGLTLLCCSLVETGPRSIFKA